MESQENISQSVPNRLRLHLSNLQLLAAMDCALAFTTLIFNIRQVISAASNVSEKWESAEHDDRIEKNTPHVRLLIATVISICLTLTQLILACFMMLSVSDVEIPQRRVRISSGMWASWSFVLLIVLIVYAFSIQRFEDVGDKFYFFMLVGEIVFRLVIIHYICLFYCCKFDRIT
ncbi:unnamed protein product [Orchesella dallaii]|uniref:Uncharacterized protein n=1 Tax=Orchesella dallaii TaxID=48710 RepID=A0ABP1PTP0_9HEXA